MPIEDLIDRAETYATIAAEAPDRQTPPQTAMGGADRSDGNWLTVADGVPCLVWTREASLDYDRNDARQTVVSARIYFHGDDVPNPGLTSRNRITVTSSAEGTPGRLLGVYAVLGAREPALAAGRLLIVDCERIRTP